VSGEEYLVLVIGGIFAAVIITTIMRALKG
jgi:hypothetical protein